MNPQLATTTETVDFVFLVIFGISAVMLLGITATMIYFLFRYNHKRHPRPTSQVASNLLLETVWTIIPTVLVMAMFYYGWAGYLALRNVPEGAMEVTVTGRMWSWLFEYDNGKTSDRLYVPAGAPVKVQIRSVDVLHSFFIPAFRVKRDAVPGMDTYVWFTASKPGSYDIFCAEYCGVAHADMITTVEALPPEEFAAWYEGEKSAAEETPGAGLLAEHGCTGCHSLDGSPGAGPTLQGIGGRQAIVVTGGRERTLSADADYLRRSIENPGADVVKGYPAIMPAYTGQIPEEDLEQIIAYMLGAQGASEPPLDGAELAGQKGCLGCHSTDGSERAGPSFKGLFGRQVTVQSEEGERSVTADAAYIRTSILHPAREVVAGYPPIMPAFADLSEAELDAIIAYLKELK
ncbi:MAG: cytochrome c oxidase subunit II [Desulfuromonas sp.]|uniref:cytochrome c oxidase subunit II n=1 Tax=Desulfuromonas sp. TaxID=892 RepID=UPI000CAA28CB|nr:cytochrome c oxidase subunit II [Desulfuromonas sp.]PLX86765.1 MAG: cytochrome c oxidase subunit II [Desulfuromonas sp.]